jgi:ribonuclease HII
MPDLSHENDLRAAGHSLVAGIDEAGRGPLAGPVAVAAVILPKDYHHPRLNDSKKLSASARESLYHELTSHSSIHWHAVLVEPAEIDRLNILRATHEGMRRAALGISPRPHAALIDGRPVPGFPLPCRALVKGDSLSFSIAAASVIAKVTRDRFMLDLARLHPGYGFEIHKGYPTPAHLDALARLGPCPAHRRSFAPVAATQGILPL